jgi:hypothetical protein
MARFPQHSICNRLLLKSSDLSIVPFYGQFVGVIKAVEPPPQQYGFRYRVRPEKESDRLKFWNKSHTSLCSVFPRPAFFYRIYRAILSLSTFISSLISIAASSGTRTVIIYAPTLIIHRNRSFGFRRLKSDLNFYIIYFILKMSAID